MSTPDLINEPPHYTYSPIEPEDVIDAWELSYRLGCVVKYLCRHEHKGTPIQDLEKARRYIDREIRRLIRQQQETDPR